MESAVAAILLEINREFYLGHARDFADTRERLQAGVRRIQQSLPVEDRILDLGCGSGTFARSLSENGHRGRYLGLDFSAGLLDRARVGPYAFPASFLGADLATPGKLDAAVLGFHDETGIQNPVDQIEKWDIVTAFAVLHHLPGRSLRVILLEQVRRWLRPGGRLILANWQFSSNARARSHILPWSTVGLDAKDVDYGDYLVDWRRGEAGVRYVHEFGDAELTELAAETGFQLEESFLSDGADRRSSLYSIWASN